MRFRTVPVQMADEVPDGSGVDSRQGSGWFRMVPVQIADAVLVQMADEVPEGSGPESF